MLSKLPEAQCEFCPLRGEPVVPSVGPFDARLVVIGEAPGAEEVRLGEPFVGPSGKVLNYALQQAGVSRDDVFATNVVACRPPNNEEPDAKSIACCWNRLVAELERTNAPVLALGRTAASVLQVEDVSMGHIVDVDGRTIMPTYHPAFILREPKMANVLIDDIKRLASPPLVEYNPKWEDPDVIVIDNIFELERMLDSVPDGTWVALDLETDNVKWYKSWDGTPPDPILMLQLAWEDTWGVVIDDLMIYDTPGVPDILRRFFDRVKIVGHNVKFDAVFLASHIGVKPHISFDTMLAHYLLDENSLHGLKELTYKYFNIPDYEERLIKQYLKNRNDRYSKIPFEPLAKYGVIDVIMTLQFRKLFQAELEAQGRLEWPFQNIMIRAENRFVNVELRGVQIDVPYMEWAGQVLEGEMSRVMEEACALVLIDPNDINFNSTQQMAVIIYDELGMPLQRSRKLNPRSTNHESLTNLKGRHPFIDKLLEFRRLAKAKSSYVDNLLEALDFEGRVHANVLLHGTEIGRLSYRNPALQTIPRPDDWIGALVRGGFIARVGRKLLICDYSQAELRVIAVLADEPFLLEAYINDRDIHGEVAIAMYGPEFTKAQRVRTKMFNFSYVYGGSEFSFAEDAGLPLSVAREFVRNYNKVMPKLAEFRKTQYQILERQGFVQSPFGRRRHFPIITKVNYDEARKAAVHAPVAGTASDLTTLSLCELDEAGWEVVLSVHDSVMIEIPEDADEEEVGTYVQSVMEAVGNKYLPQVKWKADSEVRTTWCERPTIWTEKNQLSS